MQVPLRVLLVLGFTVCVSFALGCREEHSNSQRSVENVAFHAAFSGSTVVSQPFGMGPDTRVALVPHAAADATTLTFESDPTEVEPGAILLASLGMSGLGRAIRAEDRPEFHIEVRGPGGTQRILDVTGLADFLPEQWMDFRLAIPPEVGSPITLRFEILAPDLRSADPPRAMAVWGVPRLTRSSEGERPNVLFVVFDTLRADHTEPYGYDRKTTPFLSKLAARGTKVRDVIATYPTTLSSHWSMFTGLFPSRHGIYPGGGITRPSAPTLASQFQQAGYRTAAFTEGGYVHSLFGFDQGFDVYHNGPATKLEDQSGAAEATFELARRWLINLEDEPFFLFLHTYQVHGPYSPPARYRRMFAAGYEGRWRDDFPVLTTFAVNNGKIDVSSSELTNIVNLYDAEIRQLDDLFAALWNKLESAGILENTIVILTSDHGEDLMEHGWLQHGTTLYDPALRVPLIVVAPGRVAAGATLDCQRPQTDLMPTVLELAGLPVPSGIDGKSLASELLRGSCEEDRPAFSELLESTYERHADLPLVSLRKDGWKLIRHPRSGRLEAYDLNLDVGEAHARRAATPPRGLEARLDDYIALRPPRIDPVVEEIPPGVRARLEALGYVP